ncbi:MAG: LLM class flavin-dependent oxidoreductase [Nocardiopsaceae bacterium]|nr:LLM class flavin-dependent oxidoreductase [Nocardiopsaceae bacterium]
MTKAFRFAAQATPSDGDQWLGTARRAEELGYSTLLMADGLQLLSSMPALALAAGATTALHVGNFVLASSLRAPRLAAWDAHTISVLSGGRFEFGIGTGLPQVAERGVELLGNPPTTVGQRLALAEATIDELRALDGDRHTPVLMAAGGPKSRAVAAAKADIVTLAAGPLASRDEFRALADGVLEAAGGRAGAIELANPVFVVGDEAPPWALRFMQADMATLIASDSLRILRGTPRQMADELQRRRDDLGISYTTVNAAFLEEFAPVIELLDGR